MRQYQKIPIFVLMVVYENFFYYFEVFGIYEEMYVKNNTVEKYFVLG